MSIPRVSTALRCAHHNTGNLCVGKALRGDGRCAHARNTVCSGRARPMRSLGRFRSQMIGARQQHRRNRSVVDMKRIPSMAMAGLLIALTPGLASPQGGAFRIEEASISDMHRAIQSGQVTAPASCRRISIAPRPTTAHVRRLSPKTARRCRQLWDRSGQGCHSHFRLRR